MTKQEWQARAIKLLEKEDTNILISNSGRVTVFYDVAIALAKADGLKSSKRRHVIKRFKKIIHKRIEEYIDANL